MAIAGVPRRFLGRKAHQHLDKDVLLFMVRIVNQNMCVVPALIEASLNPEKTTPEIPDLKLPHFEVHRVKEPGLTKYLLWGVD
jgi:hypothetical protein